MRRTTRALAALALLLPACRGGAPKCPEPAIAAAPTAAPTASSPPAVDAAPPSPAVDAADAAAEVVALINDGDAEQLHARFSAEMQRQVPLAALESMLPSLLEARGALTGVRPLDAREREGTFAIDAERGAWKLSIRLDDDDRIAGLLIAEPDPDAPSVGRSPRVALPFRGEWTVVWGGDTRELNYHLDHPSQRRAADLIVVDADGKSHRGEGRELRDYYAYGQEILAMADGVVVTVVDGVPDSVPGEMNPYLAPGNLVILRHEGDVYSAVAHLIPGSVKVKVGARVRAGQVLGRCGNSGNSSEPHLHVQFQDGPRFEKSWGLTPIFGEASVVRDGERRLVGDYTFRKGDRVGPPGAAEPAPRRR